MPAPSSVKTLVIAANSSWNLTNFRRAVIDALQRRGFHIVAAVPIDQSSSLLRRLGVDVEPVAIDPRGLSPLADLRLLMQYHRLIRRTAPSAFMPFTAKPNIYGSLAAGLNGVPVINTITGLGTGFLSGAALQRAVVLFYRLALHRSRRVFFHNDEDRDFFIRLGLVTERQGAVVAGSGVDLDEFSPSNTSSVAVKPTFLFVGRLLRDKGALEFVEAARILTKTHSAIFRMVGPIEHHPKAVHFDEVDSWRKEGLVDLVGSVKDVRPHIAAADCVVLPSYREGLPRVVLEASAMAKPVITTNVAGCRQAVEHRLTGLICEPRSTASLADAMRVFLQMPRDERLQMGQQARRKAEREFSQERVAGAYVDAVIDLLRSKESAPTLNRQK